MVVVVVKSPEHTAGGSRCSTAEPQGESRTLVLDRTGRLYVLTLDEVRDTHRSRSTMPSHCVFGRWVRSVEYEA